MMFAIYLAVSVAISTGAVLALLRYTPERWNSLDVKVPGFRLQASQSGDE